jgi:hypothetical protein
MYTSTLKQKLMLILFSVLTITFNSAMAKSDMQMMGEVQKAREMLRHGGDHSKYTKLIDESQKFRGVFYGYLPCDHCAGIKMTLSLKDKRNYLLVTQYAQSSNREYFEKGKYTWDETSRIVTLVARKDSSIRKLRIKNEGTLIVLTSEGGKMIGNQDKYTLLRTDKKKSRALHIH